MNYLKFGLLFTGFFPYFLHLYPSSSTSKLDLVLNPILGLNLDSDLFGKPAHFLRLNKRENAEISKMCVEAYGENVGYFLQLV